MIAMAGMFLTGDKAFSSFAMATIMVVAMAVLGSLTVLPALLSRLGDRVNKARVPFLHRLQRPEGGRVWGWILDRVLRRPLLSALVSAGILVALALPALGMKTVVPGVEALPQDLQAVQVYNRLQSAFPGEQEPAVVVVKASSIDDPQVDGAIASLRRQALASGRVHEPVTIDVNDARTVARIELPIDGTGNDAASYAAVSTLRDEIVPRTVGSLDGVEAGVTGSTAGSKDFESALRGTAPVVFAFVLALAFLLLLVSFRSVVIAIKAIVLNLLSVAAAYGVLVLVFQHGWGAVHSGLRLLRRRDGLASGVPVRDPLRALDGLPRVHPQPRAGGVRRRHDNRGRDLARDQDDRRRRDERGDRDGVRLFDLCDAVADHDETVRRRARSRGPDRRHDRQGRASARDDEATRRVELVPATLARMAAHAQFRGQVPRDPHRSSGRP